MTLRAGLVGLGSMGRDHARVLRSMDGVRLVGVVDAQGDPDRAVEPVPVHRDLESLIEAGVDFCVVAAPTESHHRVGMALARAGVPALIEKPLAADSTQAEELVEAFSRRGLVGAVGHVERFNPAILQMRDRLAAGDIGEVFQVATRRQGPYPVRVCDVGVVMDLATHDLDLTAFVTGSHYADVSARTAHRSGREHEDLVAVVGSLTDGTIVNHLVNWLSPLKERVSVATGERGTLVADTVFGDLTRHENGVVATKWDAMAAFRGVTEGDVTRFAFPKHEPLRRELEAMRDAGARYGQRDRVPGRWGPDRRGRRGPAQLGPHRITDSSGTPSTRRAARRDRVDGRGHRPAWVSRPECGGGPGRRLRGRVVGVSGGPGRRLRAIQIARTDQSSAVKAPATPAPTWRLVPRRCTETVLSGRP